MTTDEALLMDQLRAELAVATAQVDELRGWVERWKLAAREVGFAPEGSHPDEQKPRAETWHAERLNWIAEVNQLRAQVDALTAEARAWKDAATAPEAELAKWKEYETEARETANDWESNCALARKERNEARAELAKAWCAGRDAAAD